MDAKNWALKNAVRLLVLLSFVVAAIAAGQYLATIAATLS